MCRRLCICSLVKNSILAVLFVIDVAGIFAGIWAMQLKELSRKLAAISGGVMLGVALFWVWPDLRRSAGLEHSFITVVVGVAALYAVDRFIYPVCPCCAHGHRFQAGGGALLPLFAAICVHNLFDGWTAGMTMHVGAAIRSGLSVGLIAHKVPEAFVFGLMLRAASKNGKALIVIALGSGSCILAGGMMHAWTLNWATLTLTLSLAAACATFLFAGFHIFEGQRRHGGLRSAFAALLLGLVGTLALERGISFVIGS